MAAEFLQVDWSDDVAAAARRLVRLALEEDLAGEQDWTTTSLVPLDACAAATLVARDAGVLCGMRVVPLVLDEYSADVVLQALIEDGDPVMRGQSIGQLSGSARDLLTIERTALNFVGRLSGVATLTRRFVDAVAGSAADIYDTRKTTPGWRLLEKYAVRCGGGFNHRLGLHRAVMIKDNHVALAQDEGLDLPAAIARVRQALATEQASVEAVEVEVDTIDQLQAVLPVGPDIVLLDNMTLADLRRAVELRDKLAPTIMLEASGGVDLETVGGIAKTGVDRISCGALTHSAPVFDVGLDWAQ